MNRLNCALIKPGLCSSESFPCHWSIRPREAALCFFVEVALDPLGIDQMRALSVRDISHCNNRLAFVSKVDQRLNK